MAMIFDLLPRFLFADASASLLGWREAPIDERFLQIQIALVVQCLSEDFEDAPQHADAGGAPVRAKSDQ